MKIMKGIRFNILIKLIINNYYLLFILFVIGCAPLIKEPSPIKELTEPRELSLTNDSMPANDELASFKFKIFPDVYAYNPKGEESKEEESKDIEKVSVGKFQIAYLPPRESSFHQMGIVPDRAKWDLFLIYIPFTLYPLPNQYSYKNVKFFIKLHNLDATAFDLFPRNITSKQDIHKKYILSPEFKFKNFEGKVGELSYIFNYQILQPVISAFGLGENLFYWEFESNDTEPLLPGTKHVFVVLQVPSGTKFIDGTLHFEILGKGELLGGLIQPKYSSTRFYEIKCNLRQIRERFLQKRGTALKNR